MSRESPGNIRVRMAPSPTGFLHIGTLRTALFNWLFARRAHGVFIVRIEDTDRERSKKEFEEDILAGFSWLELEADEFYHQSERMKIYKKYLEKLLAEKKAFYCPHTVEELEQESARQKNNGEAPRHICSERDGKEHDGIIRFRNDASGEVIVRDIIRGEIRLDPLLLGDFSLAKKIDEPLYNFAAVVDDFEMKISHVIRGEDHLPNTPKQILLAWSLGFQEPLWAHLPLLLGADRSKLSKRHGALSVGEYRARGYLPEAILNFLFLLGWHPAGKEGEREKEIFSREEMIGAFSLEMIQKGGAVASLEKLDWFNKHYLKTLPAETIMQHAENIMAQQKLSKSVFEVLRSRVATLLELRAEAEMIDHPAKPSRQLLSWQGKISVERLHKVLNQILEALEKLGDNDWDKNSIESALANLVEHEGKGDVLWPLRAALSGKEKSPGPYELAEIMGKEKTLARLGDALKIL